MQETILKLLINIQNSSFVEVLPPYYLPYCRKELYSVLLELVVQPSPKWPPPIHHAVRLFKNGQNDDCLEIVAFCSSALNSITAVIHQQYSNGLIYISEENNRKKQNNNKVINLMAKDVDGGVENESENGNDEEVEIERGDDCEEVQEREKEKEDRSQVPENVDETIPGEECDVEMEKSNGEVDDQREKFQEIGCGKEPLENNGDVIEIEGNNENVCLQPELKESPRKLPLVMPQGEENSTTSEIEDGTNNTNKSFHREKDSPNKELMDENGEEEPKTKKMKISQFGDLNVSSSNSSSRSQSSSKLSEPENVSVDEEDDIIICEVVNKSSSELPAENEQSLRQSEKRKSKRRIREKSASDDSNSEKSVTPGPVDTSYENCKTGDSKKRYFLRSKTGQSSSEEPEESLKKAESLESLKNTPFKDGGGKSTPSSSGGLSVSRRPRTRALSKLKLDENESEIKTIKLCGDDDEDIIESFNESLVE